MKEVKHGERASLCKEHKVATVLQFSGLRYEKRGQSRVVLLLGTVFGRLCERACKIAGLGGPKSTC